MDIIFRNLSSDLPAKIVFKSEGLCFEVGAESENKIAVQGDEILFYVKYDRDFTFGYRPPQKEKVDIKDYISEKLTEKAINSVGNGVLQVANTYRVSHISDNMVIELSDKAHLILPEGIDALFNCFPAILYFGRVECSGGVVEVASSACFNRPGFISLYKLIYRTINLHGFFFNILKYKIQINRQRKISSTNYLTLKFRVLYGLSLDERNYQFKPLNVLGDKLLDFAKGKLPKRIYKKLSRKIKRTLGI